jgi:hypothetical protein
MFFPNGLAGIYEKYKSKIPFLKKTEVEPEKPAEETIEAEPKAELKGAE